MLPSNTVVEVVVDEREYKYSHEIAYDAASLAVIKELKIGDWPYN